MPPPFVCASSARHFGIVARPANRAGVRVGCISLSRDGGFSLVELLVSIVIVAVVLTFTVSVASSLRVTMRDRQCQANLRQIYIGLNLYIQDSGGLLPLPGNPQPASWPAVLGEKGLKLRTAVMKCPADPSADNSFFFAGYSYSMNGLLYSTLSASEGYSPLRYRQIQQPENVIFMGDANTQKVGRSFGVSTFYGDRHPSRKDASGRANLLFLDGHIEQLSREETTKPMNLWAPAK